jgi:hypothetical protein
MLKIDLKKDLPRLYQASAREPAIVEVPALNFLMLDGAGDPNGSVHFQAAAAALFSVAYTLRSMVKKEQAIDYRVMPLEGLWSADDPTQFSPDRKDLWKWTLMIMQPVFVTSNLVRLALEQVSQKKKLPDLDRMKFLKYREGLAAQILHVGPYAEEWPAVAGLHDFIQARGYQPRGNHHEIYLRDPRRCAPEKLPTIIRQPIV